MTNITNSDWNNMVVNQQIKNVNKNISYSGCTFKY